MKVLAILVITATPLFIWLRWLSRYATTDYSQPNVMLPRNSVDRDKKVC